MTNFLRKAHNFDLLDSLFENHISRDEHQFASDFYLSESMIMDMVDMGMIVGGHGYISENLTSLPNPDFDIHESNRFVSKFNDATTFSYPNGGIDDEIKASVHNSGFKIAFTTRQATVTELDEVDFLEFPRYDSPQRVPLPL